MDNRNLNLKQLTHSLLAGCLLSLIFLVSCKDNSVTTPVNNVEVSYTSTTDTVDNSGVLIIDTAKILLKDIKLNVAGSTGEKNFKTGNYVLYLILDARVMTIGSAYIPVGTYDKVNFEIHKLQDNETPPDPDFVDANGRYSTVAKGTYNGTPFIFKSDISASQKIRMTNELVVTETSSNITLKVEPYIWFINAAGQYMDPNDPGNHNEIENNIKDNVKGNFKSFKDNDKNGIPD